MTRIAPLEADVNTSNDALQEPDDEIKHPDLQVATLRTQQYEAIKAIQASYNSDANKTLPTSYNTKPPPSNPLKAEQAHVQITENLREAQQQLDGLDVEHPRKKKIYDNAVAAVAPFIKLPND